MSDNTELLKRLDAMKTVYYGFPRQSEIHFINPDGPSAARVIRTLEARVAELEKAEDDRPMDFFQHAVAGVALQAIAHPIGSPVPEDADIDPDSITVVGEYDDETGKIKWQDNE